MFFDVNIQIGMTDSAYEVYIQSQIVAFRIFLNERQVCYTSTVLIEYSDHVDKNFLN